MTTATPRATPDRLAITAEETLAHPRPPRHSRPAQAAMPNRQATALRHPSADHHPTPSICSATSPALVLFDFSAALLSLSRSFAEATLRDEVGLGIRNVICAMYVPTWSYIGRPDSATTLGFRVATGAPQGCARSGTVFACATVTLISLLVDTLGKNTASSLRTRRQCAWTASASPARSNICLATTSVPWPSP